MAHIVSQHIETHAAKFGLDPGQAGEAVVSMQARSRAAPAKKAPVPEFSLADLWIKVLS